MRPEAFEEWLKPNVINYTYWHKKAKFQLKEDSYSAWVMFAVEEGSFSYRIGEAAGTAVFGDAVLCPPGLMFEREVVEPVSFHFITLKDVMEPIPPVHLTWIDHNRLSSTYFYIHQLMRLPDDRQPALLNHYVHDLWQLYHMESGFTRMANEQLNKDPGIVEAARWLQQHAFGTIILKELSASLGLNPVQFTRKFQTAYGTTPIEYLTSLRVQKAQTLLLETEMTLEQIAERCGYESGFYLSRVFSKKMKQSPSQYRRTHRV
jgi:AraC family transcriptional regulator